MAKAPPIQEYLLLKRHDQTHDVFELTFERPVSQSFKAGQFISIVIPGAGPGGRDLRRAYSIASAPESENFQLSIKLVTGGPGTTYLNSLKVGDRIRGQFPMGDFVMSHPEDAPAIFIGTGTGLAPHRAMILSKERDWQKSAPVVFLQGVRSEEDIIYPELFTNEGPEVLRKSVHTKIALSRPKNPDVWSKNSFAYIGRVTDYIYKQLQDWPFEKSHFYLCGSGAMINEVQDWLLNEKKLDKTQIHKEAYFK